MVKLRTAFRLRLEMLIPYISAWSQAMGVGARPANLHTTLETIAVMIDEIWHICGDKSTDISWYTKRALLGSAYASAELYMITDKSVDFEDTWAFLDRRLADVQMFDALPHEFMSTVHTAGSVLHRTFGGVGAMGGAQREHREEGVNSEEFSSTGVDTSTPEAVVVDSEPEEATIDNEKVKQ